MVNVTSRRSLTWWSTIRLWFGVRVIELGLWIIGDTMDVEVS